MPRLADDPHALACILVFAPRRLPWFFDHKNMRAHKRLWGKRTGELKNTVAHGFFCGGAYDFHAASRWRAAQKGWRRINAPIQSVGRQTFTPL
jgi:hypothetical protein